jgi:hypothetical protein
MERQTMQQELTTIAFDFFYCFSRFEFAMKENHFLKSCVIGVRAEPGWHKFVQFHQPKYVLTDSAARLIKAPPAQQIVGVNSLSWQPVRFAANATDLNKVVAILKTLRNNLFHGGKHGIKDWDEPLRTAELLKLGRAVLDELAKLAGFEADYERRY